MDDLQLERTLDPGLRSWVASANAPDTDFPIQNLPFGRFRRPGEEEGAWRIGVAIGDQVLDLERAGLVAGNDMGRLMGQDTAARQALRCAISRGLAEGSAKRETWLARAALVAQAQVELGLPCAIRDYTDFYAGIHHATTIGRMFFPDQPLSPNYKWMPLAYHGRASSVGVSGQRFHRPHGQALAPGAAAPLLGPSACVDFELELGAFIGKPGADGIPVAIGDAEEHLFGFTLLNDWSARDIQSWEYQPLGPFLSKSFATTISPWIVTLDALAPFRAPHARPAGDPAPLPYLDGRRNRACGAIDITLEVWLQSAAMARAGLPPERLMTSNYRDAYWSVAQMVAHHTVNGCPLRSGDLLGSGTLSGPRPEQGGSLLELGAAGRRALALSNGETRSWLQDGDTVILRGFCARPGYRRIGFGECAGTLLAARGLPRRCAAA